MHRMETWVADQQRWWASWGRYTVAGDCIWDSPSL